MNRLVPTPKTPAPVGRSTPYLSQPSAPRVLQSSRTPQQMAFVFHRG